MIVTTCLTMPWVGRAVGRVFGDRIPFYGCIIDVGHARMSPGTKASIFFRLYERAEATFVRRYLPSGTDVIELGAGIGVVTTQVCRNAGRVISVEADRDLFGLLERTTAENCPGHVDVVNAAVAYNRVSDPLVRFVKDSYHLGGRLAAPEQLAIDSAEVPCVTLKSLLELYDIGEFCLVSDIEGAEAGIFLEDEVSLAHCTWMIIELHPTTFRGTRYDVPALSELIEACGFTEVDRYGANFVFVRI